MLRATPPGEDGILHPRAAQVAERDDIENEAMEAATGNAVMPVDNLGDDEYDERPSDAEFLQFARDAESQSQVYSSQVNRRSWQRAYRAFHQQHTRDSKYESKDYLNRSRLFIPKTRTAVRKDMAAVAASLFGSIDAVNCMAGNEGDPIQRASAAVIQEVMNYRTDRSSGKASIPWFHVAMGSRQTTILTGVCLSKQSWKLDLRREGTEEYDDDETGEKGTRDVWKPFIDRPNCQLVPPENYVMDPAADWTNPVQESAYLITKWPMRIDEILQKQRDPRNPWKKVSMDRMKSAGKTSNGQEQAAIRRARERGIDRLDDTQTGNHFDVVWVWEVFIRTAGEDWTFWCLNGMDLLTDPSPVRSVYPEQMGERPYTLGYGSLEAFSTNPMSPAESWQPLQQEANDIRNLGLDAVKQNVMPVTKVRRGRSVDLDQLKRRGQGTSIMVTDPNDITFEKAPDISAGLTTMKQNIDIEFDDLAGQQNYGTVQTNNSLGNTLGGLKLAAGTANAVQEFDIRVWIETWCEPTLMQIIRLIQYYESDPIILGLSGDRAKLLEKYGINEITDDLLEQNVTIRVNIGLGSGDPQQRLAKFQSAVGVALPLLEKAPQFQSGEMTIDAEAVMSEVFGAAGYRDGGKRFVKTGPARQNPMQQPQLDKLQSETEKNQALAKAAILNAISNAAKVGVSIEGLKLDRLEAEFGMHVEHVEQVGRAHDMGYRHGHDLADRRAAAALAAAGKTPDGAPMQAPGGEGGGGASPMVESADAPGAGNAGVNPADLSKHGVPAADAGQQAAQDSAEAGANLQKNLKAQPKSRRIEFHRDPKTNRISGATVHSDA